MCHEATGANYDRPLVAEDLPMIAEAYPDIEPGTLDEIYSAITDHHYPQPAVLIAVCEMIKRSLLGDKGFYPYPTMPFSAMDLDTHERVQTDGMHAFHSVFESMALAQRNMHLLNQVLKERLRLQLVLFCDCGCSMMPADEDPFGDIYKRINKLRSLAEAIGTPVIRISDFMDPLWSNKLLDMGPAETESYNRMYALLQDMPHRELDIHQMANQDFKELFLMSA